MNKESLREQALNKVTDALLALSAQDYHKAEKSLAEASGIAGQLSAMDLEIPSSWVVNG
jgi:hypothetical protein